MRIQELEAEVDKLKNNNKELFENCRILQKENKNLSQYADRV